MKPALDPHIIDDGLVIILPRQNCLPDHSILHFATCYLPDLKNEEQYFFTPKILPTWVFNFEEKKTISERAWEMHCSQFLLDIFLPD